MQAPAKLEFCQWVGGSSFPIWRYEEPPEGMVPASPHALCHARPVMWQVQIGPDAGRYYAARVTSCNRPVLLDYIRRGIPVLVRAK